MKTTYSSSTKILSRSYAFVSQPRTAGQSPAASSEIEPNVVRLRISDSYVTRIYREVHFVGISWNSLWVEQFVWVAWVGLSMMFNGSLGAKHPQL